MATLTFTTNGALTSLDGLEALTTVNSDLSIDDNDALTDVTGLNSVSKVGGNLRIVNNNALATSDAEALYAEIGDENITGSVTISGNGS